MQELQELCVGASQGSRSLSNNVDVILAIVDKASKIGTLFTWAVLPKFLLRFF